MPAMPFLELTDNDRQVLLAIARQAIQYGLAHREPLEVEVEQYTQTLQDVAATFVTLKQNHQLRGCIGTLVPYQALILDVVEHAYAAAFQDPRFPPLSHAEEPEVGISISILSAAESLLFSSEQDLLSQLTPGKDGLILEFNHHKGTFLPSVWREIKDPETFVKQLKRKAGLAADFWDANIKISRYFSELVE